MRSVLRLLLLAALCSLAQSRRPATMRSSPQHPLCKVALNGSAARRFCRDLEQAWTALEHLRTGGNNTGQKSATLPANPWFGPSKPSQIHLAMTARRTVYKVIWQTNSSFSRPVNTTRDHGNPEWCPYGPDCPAMASEVPYVRYGITPSNLSRLSSGVKRTYRRADMCGYPAAALPGGLEP